MIKGNAYGHGIEQFVPIAIEAGINHFSVYSSDEAERVLKITRGETVTICIMGLISNEALPWAIKNNIEFFVFEPDRLLQAIKIAKRLRKKAIVHLEIETGMNRTGIEEHQFKDIIKHLEDNEDHILLKGICTHFAGAENIANYLRIKNQKINFNRALGIFSKAGIYPELRHANCSAAMIRYPEMNLDMVRIGILQYGLWPSMETFIDFVTARQKKDDPLKRLITWKSRVMSTKEVKTGEFIGYGTSYIAPKDMKVATVPVGYSHGYSRALSNQGQVLVNGMPSRIVGIVNMNALMLDITECPQAQKGDEVILVGSSNGHSISIASFSELSNQLNYELLTRLPMNIPRIIVE